MNAIAKHPRRKKLKKKHFSGFYPNLLIKVIIWVHKKGHILSLSEKLKCAQKLYLLITWWVCRVCTILWTLRRLVLIFDGWCSVSTTYFSVCTKWQKVFVEKVADTFFLSNTFMRMRVQLSMCSWIWLMEFWKMIPFS